MAFTITLAETSHRDWTQPFQVTDGDASSPTFGDLIDLTGAFIAVAVEDNECCQRILATTNNGLITIVSTGVFELNVPQEQMNLIAGSYSIGGYYQLNGDTIDLFEGSLTLRRGIPKP